MNGLTHMVNTAIAKDEDEEFQHPVIAVITELKRMLLEAREKAISQRKNYYGYKVDDSIVFSLANKDLSPIITIRVNGKIKFNIDQYEIYKLVKVEEDEETEEVTE